MTFDVLADVFTYRAYGWQTKHEAAVNCRQCDRLSVMKLALSDVALKNEFPADMTISKLKGDLGKLFKSEGFISVADLADVAEPPQSLPTDIESAFVEGAKCISINCYNAAAAMFRLCLDLTTKPLLPDPAEPGVEQPTKEQRFKLAKRIDWLMQQRKIAPELSNLAHCVREDANDGIHDGSLGPTDAQDLLEFTQVLLDRHFSEPARLRLAELRRAARREARDRDLRPR